MSITPYQGGMPSLHTRFAPRQRGGGFFSSLKRFLLPLAKTAMPHVAGAVGDLISGRGAVDILKSRGRAAGADIMERAAGVIRDESTSPASPPPAPAPQKGIKRRATPKKVIVGKKSRNQWS